MSVTDAVAQTTLGMQDITIAVKLQPGVQRYEAVPAPSSEIPADDTGKTTSPPTPAERTSHPEVEHVESELSQLRDRTASPLQGGLQILPVRNAREGKRHDERRFVRPPPGREGDHRPPRLHVLQRRLEPR